MRIAKASHGLCRELQNKRLPVSPSPLIKTWISLKQRTRSEAITSREQGVTNANDEHKPINWVRESGRSASTNLSRPPKVDTLVKVTQRSRRKRQPQNTKTSNGLGIEGHPDNGALPEQKVAGPSGNRATLGGSRFPAVLVSRLMCQGLWPTRELAIQTNKAMVEHPGRA